MRMLNVMLAVVVMMLGALVGKSRADDTTTDPGHATWATTMPAIELSGRPLEKVLNEIKAKCPGFKFAVQRAGVSDDYPILPQISMHGGSLEDFIRLLPEAVPGLEVKAEGMVLSPSIAIGFAGQTAPEITITVRPDTNSQPSIVRVFGLEDLVAYRASLLLDGSKEQREKQATNDILSAVQAATDLSDDKSHPVMKVHSATHTLLFKGTQAQAEIAANALAALQPADDSHSLRGAFSTVVAENRELKEQLEKIKGATTQPITERDASTRPMPTTR
jgi:hypothetical protein